MVARAKERIQKGQSIYMRLSGQNPVPGGQGGAATGGGQARAGQTSDKLYDVHGAPTLEITTPPDTLPRKEGS
jgi:hypothetical protein